MGWSTSLSQSVKKIDIWIISLSHSAEVFEVWNTRLSSIVKILLSWLPILYHSVAKKRMQLKFFLAVSKKLIDEWQGGQTVSKILWQECISFLPHSLENFVSWITFSNHKAKTFDVWFTTLTHSVEKNCEVNYNFDSLCGKVNCKK